MSKKKGQSRTRSESAVGFQAVSGISQPGTIVDKVIGDPFLYNLLFQSQASLNVFSASQRATKSVGITTPTYYANLVATKAKKWDISVENSSTVFTTNSGA
ncbi:hypothetical protein BY996DRAFT_6410998 [Phakopsora pachyrhizi]|nr:hypothetical protein BY996DRAFT_6410998 [Phakopsora pachyrhizi]